MEIEGHFIFDPSLVLYLPLYSGACEGSSFISKDAQGHLCTVTGALWRSNGRYFDGNDDLITVLASDVLQFESSTQSFSLMAWVKRHHGTDVEYILDCRDADDDGWRFLIHSNTKVYCSLNTVVVYTNSLTEDTNWHCYCVSINRVGNGQMYLDGQANGPAVAMMGITMSIDSNLVIGRESYQAANYLQGTIGEILIYSRALTSLEIHHNYLATKWRYK